MRGRAVCAVCALCAVCAVLAGALLVACDGEPPAPAPPPPAAAPAPRSAAPAAELELPDAGAARVARRDELYTVLANQALPFDILVELGGLAGFRAERGAGALPEEPRSLALRDVPLERALAEILAPGPYHVHYEPVKDEPGGGERPISLTRVTLGALPAAELAEKRAPQAPEGARFGRGKALRHDAGGERQRGDAAEGERGDAAEGERGDAAEGERGDAAERERERAETVARQLLDSRPTARLEAIALMDPEGDERPRLEALLREDPSGEVRAAAADLLAQGDAFEVTPGLLAGLADPDPSVVAAVVRGLEDVYDEAPDPRIRESVGALREHRDPAVREAVAEFEEWIE